NIYRGARTLSVVPGSCTVTGGKPGHRCGHSPDVDQRMGQYEMAARVVVAGAHRRGRILLSLHLAEQKLSRPGTPGKRVDAGRNRKGVSRADRVGATQDPSD